jgi:hypothetical protein
MRHVVDELKVISVPVPKDTETYRAVPHSQIISLVKEHSQKFGYQISDTRYRMNRDGRVMSGLYKLETGDKEMSMMLGFYNSYDKSKRFGIGSGAIVNICYNGMIMAEYSMMRKHTGTIKEEMDEMIYNAILSVRPQFEEAQEEKLFFSQQPVDDISQVYELIGELYLTEDLLAANQLSALKRAASDPNNYFRVLNENKLIPGVNMWNMYNLVTEVYKNETAVEFVDKHVGFHSFMKDKFNHEQHTTTPISLIPEIF